MTQTDAIALMPQQDHPEFYTLQDIARECGVSYKYARQYADAPGVKAFLGAYEHPASKGVRYPPESLAGWRALIDAASKKLLTPQTATGWIANIEITTGRDIAPLPQRGETALSLTPVQAIAQLPAMGETALDLGAEAVALLRQLVKQEDTPPEDRILDAHEAAQLLCCKPRAVSRYVTPVRPGRWRRSDILRWIQQQPPGAK